MQHISWIYKLAAVFFIAFLYSCTALNELNLYSLYGPSEPRDRQVASLGSGEIDYWKDVSPVIEKRCVVCHGCYDAPCQLKLSSLEGIERGATLKQVYNPTRLFESESTRLFEDAHNTHQWREKGFHPVLNEHIQTPEANREVGVMHQILQLKAEHPLPSQAILGKEFGLGLDRKHSCPNPEEFEKYSQDHPLWGMPYALPGLNKNEQHILVTWLEQGATYTAPNPMPTQYQQVVNEWEQFLNQDSNKGQLISRYIYEHLFLANLYFDELGQNTHFRLVRSKTPPGRPIDLIATRRPYDDPGIKRVYYRLSEYKAAIVAKTHMPYALNKNRMTRWNELFFKKKYTVDTLPSYDLDYATNPFVVFFQIPTSSRYQFMLDEAQFTVMGFIKGPVCRGHVALNVINDHFWVLFSKPDETYDSHYSDFIRKNYELLDMPTKDGPIFRPITAWKKYSEKQRQFLKQRDHYFTNLTTNETPITLDAIWDGNGRNDNAALTIFRHFDSATVEKGLIGGKPQTTWMLGYFELERIHYLLVAGYDVYGNLGHQLLSRLYMDFLRMEGESNFLLLLPQETRDQLRSQWYRNADEELMTYLKSPEFEKNHQYLDINYKTNNPENELLIRIQEKLDSVLPKNRNLLQLENQTLAKSLLRIHDYTGTQIANMPENAFILIETEKGDLHFTLLKNNAHLNMTSMFGEHNNRVPEDDQLLILRGFVGSYPNAFFKLKEHDIDQFVRMLENTGDTEHYQKLVDAFGVRRTDKQFWSHSDRVHQAYQLTEPKEYGLLDYNRLENR